MVWSLWGAVELGLWPWCALGWLGGAGRLPFSFGSRKIGGPFWFGQAVWVFAVFVRESNGVFFLGAGRMAFKVKVSRWPFFDG